MKKEGGGGESVQKVPANPSEYEQERMIILQRAKIWNKLTVLLLVLMMFVASTATVNAAVMKPTWATVSLEKAGYGVGEEVTFQFRSGGGTLGQTYYTLYIWGNNGFTKSYGTGNSNLSLTFSKAQAGAYRCCVCAYNSGGMVTSNEISFFIDIPHTWASVNLDRDQYKNGENLNFQFSNGGGTMGNTYYTLCVQGDNGFNKSYYTGNTNFSLTFSEEQAGNYTAYIVCSNAGGSVESSSIKFSIISPLDQKINEFINDSRWENGTTWGNKTPEINKEWSTKQCAAYVADFIKYVHGVSSPYANGVTKYTSVSEIRKGDVIYGWGNGVQHWMCVLERDGNTLRIAEGNISGKVRISYMTLKGNDIYNSNGKYFKTFQYGFHF